MGEGEAEVSKCNELFNKYIKPFLLVIAVVVVCLSIAGIANHGRIEAVRGLFIAILILSLLALVVALVHKLLKNTSSRSSYQISEGKYPAGSPMDDVTFTSEKEVNVNKEVDNKDVTDGKDGEEEAKWKDNYVPYEEAENKSKEEEE